MPSSAGKGCVSAVVISSSALLRVSTGSGSSSGLGNRPPEEQIPTAELPKPDEEPEPVETLSSAELEMTTADTQPLPAELRHVVEEAAASAAAKEIAAEPTHEAKMEETKQEGSQTSSRYEGAGEVLLDLGDYARGRSLPDDDFVLDIDLDEAPEPSPAAPAFSTSAFRPRYNYGAGTQTTVKPLNGSAHAPTMPLDVPETTTDQLANTQEWERSQIETVEPPTAVAAEAERVTPMAEGSTPQLSQEMIDTIARRAVEQLSEKVVQEIAWEVVPQLAELLIKRQLEEKNS